MNCSAIIHSFYNKISQRVIINISEYQTAIDYTTNVTADSCKVIFVAINSEVTKIVDLYVVNNVISTHYLIDNSTVIRELFIISISLSTIYFIIVFFIVFCIRIWCHFNCKVFDNTTIAHSYKTMSILVIRCL